MRAELEKEGIVKEEKVGYLKSSMNLLQGTLFLTENRLALDAHKTGVGGFGLLGAILKRKVEAKSFGFELELKDIQSVKRGKHGVNKNVLEITDKNNETFRVLVKDYDEWESKLKA